MKHRRRRRRKQMKLVQWYNKLSTRAKVLLIVGIFALCIIAAIFIYVASKLALLNTEKIDKDEIVVNELDETVGVGYTNFVLFGGDSRTGDVTKDLNTDSIIIVSLNNENKEVKLVSVYRDTLLDLTNGSIQKCNSAYSRGGATQAMSMLNMNLDLNIQKYVTVDFGAVADLVDLLGGIEIDVSEKEYKAVNLYIDETGKVAGKKANHLTHAGVQTLDGVQATTYARIRKGVGDDYARTERQRLIIQKVVEKAIKSDFATINKIIDAVFPQIATNFSMTEILSYAKSFAKYKITENAGFPFEKGSGTIPKKGSSVYAITLKKNVTMLHEFLYGTEGYEPSEKVCSISDVIAGIVGSRPVDKPSTGGGTGTGTPNTGGENTGGENTGGENTGGENTGGENTGGENTGGENTGGENTGGENTGGENTGGENTGGENTGGENTGGENTGGENTGGEETGGSTGNQGGDSQTGGNQGGTTQE